MKRTYKPEQRRRHYLHSKVKEMTVQELHLKAIELADNAFILKFRDNLEAATKQFVAAFQLEKQAALLAQEQSIGEPTISVLFKSAASLAINANELNEAEKLICLALCGEPPVDIAEELRNILEELYFQRQNNKLKKFKKMENKMEKQQIAIEWLVDMLDIDKNDSSTKDVIEQAKAMEKEQIMDAFVECWKSNVPDAIECKLDAEQYYNETFKSE